MKKKPTAPPILGMRPAQVIIDDPLALVLSGEPLERGRQRCWQVTTEPRAGGTEIRTVWARTKAGARWRSRRQIAKADRYKATITRFTGYHLGFDLAGALSFVPPRMVFHKDLFAENMNLAMERWWSRSQPMPVYDPPYQLRTFPSGARDPLDEHLATRKTLAGLPGTAAHGLRVAKNLRRGDPYFPASDREHRFVQAELATRLLSLVPAHVAGMEPHYIVVDGGRIKIVGDTSAFVEALQKSLLTFPSPARKQVGVIAPHSC